MTGKGNYECKSYPMNNGLDNSPKCSSKSETKYLHIINSIRFELEKIKGEMDKFRGHFRNQEYNRLDELLLRQTEALDSVIGSTVSGTVRKEKQRLMNDIQQCEKVLESKLF